MDLTSVKSVAIIGASVAGLSAAKLLHEQGLVCTVFERSATLCSDLPNNCSNAGMQVQRELYEFPDWPFPKDAPKFMPEPMIQKYLEDYAKHFGVWSHIHFKTSVTQILKRRGDKPGWLIHVNDDGIQRKQSFDLVVVCVGPFRLTSTLISNYYRFSVMDHFVLKPGRPLVWIYWRLQHLLLLVQSKMRHLFGIRECLGTATNVFVSVRKSDFHFLSQTIRTSFSSEKDGLYLYRQILHPDVPYLIFIGQALTVSNALTSSLQVRWLCELIKGTHQLPTRKNMLRNLDEIIIWKHERIPFSAAYSANLIFYMQQYHDKLLKDFGASPFRKTGFFAPLKEIFSPYHASDYQTIITGAWKRDIKVPSESICPIGLFANKPNGSN